MMTRLRQDYERMSTPLGRFSVTLGIKPNHWTILSLLTGSCAGVLFALHHVWGGVVLMLVMIVTDVLDGATARAGSLGTLFGGVFDHSIDRYVEFIIIGGLMVGGYISILVGMFVISGMIMASYVRAAGESIGRLENCVVGIAGRQEKLFLLFLGLVLIGFGQVNFAQIPIIAIGIVSHITVIQRLLFVAKNTKEGIV